MSGKGFAAKTLIILIALFAIGAVTTTPALSNGGPPPVSEDVAAKEAAAKAERERAAKKAEAEQRAEEARTAAAAKKAAAARRAAEEAAAKKRAEAAQKEAAANAWRNGMTLVQEGQYLTAKHFLTRLVENGHGRNADAWYWLSRAHHALGDYDRSQWAASVALAIDPEYPALTKTPSGLEPRPKPKKGDEKYPRAEMAVLPVKPPMVSGLALEPTLLRFPILELRSGDYGLTNEQAAAMKEISPDWTQRRVMVKDAELRYEPYPPLEARHSRAWMQGERFNEIGRARGRVDRMAIVEQPRIAIAWKGEYPIEVYFWTGTEWAIIRTLNEPTGAGIRKEEKVEAVIGRVRDSLDEVLAAKGYAWDERDTTSLASAARQMRYWWQGEIYPQEAVQAEKKGSAQGTVNRADDK